MDSVKMPLLSIVSPVYNAEDIIDTLVQEVISEVSQITQEFEFVLVDDGSSDASWERIGRLCQTREEIKGIKLSRNFGQHYAITAGLDIAKGEWIVVMDCDMQDRPEEIKRLYYKAIKGYDVVQAQRQNRQDPIPKKLLSFVFYKALSYLTGTSHDYTIANFGIYNRKVIQAVNMMKESIRYFPTMVNWVGFRHTTLEVVHGEREKGKTTYNFKRRLNLALDIVLAYSDKPLRLIVKFGCLISIISLCVAVYYLCLALFNNIAVLGFASLIISIWLLSGIIISILGTTGLYVGKIFEGVKNRPIYIIEQTVNTNKHPET